MRGESIYRIFHRVRFEESGCWIYTGAVNSAGYGITYDRGKTGALVHRVVYRDVVQQPIPPNYDINHLCCRRSCCNPDHLECVTRRENLLKHAVKTHCARKLHELTPENTYQYPSSPRVNRCRQCYLEWQRNKRRK